MVLTASAMATCTMAMQRDHGLPATFPALRTSMDVWFHSVTVSAPAWPAVRAIASVATRSESHRRLLAPANTLLRSCLDARPLREKEHGVSDFMTASESKFEIPPGRVAGRLRVGESPDARCLLLHGLEVQRDSPLSHLPPEHESVLAGAAEVNARIDAGIGALPRRLGEARERPLDPLERLPARDCEFGLVAAQDTREDDGGGAAEDALRRGIVRDRGGVLVAVPGRIARGGIVSVVVSLTDGRDGAPEVVHVADLEACDVGIGHRHVHEGQHPRAVPEIKAARGGHRARNRIPDSGTLEPEPRDLRLIGRADRAHLPANVLDLVEITRVGRARQGRGPRKPERSEE